MGQPEINQMIQALKKQGISSSRLCGLSEEQLRKMCDERLAQSLSGDKFWGNTDEFKKQHEYNLIFTAQHGEKVKVARLAYTVLPSGRKIETFIDIAGNQYFQYRAADGTILKEDYFKKQEKMILGSGFKFVNNKLYKTDLLGNLLSVVDDKTKEQKSFDVHNIIEQNKVKYHSVYKDLMLDNKGNIDMSQFSFDYLKTKYDKSKYKYKTEKDDYDEFEKLTIIDKATNQIVCECKKEYNTTEYTSYKDGKAVNHYEFTDENISLASHTYPDGSYVQHTYYNGKITGNKFQDKNGNFEENEYKNGQICYKMTNDKITYYSNGKPYQIIDRNGGGEKFPIVDELYRKLTNKDNNGYSVIDRSVIDDIKRFEDDYSTDEIIRAYREQYNTGIENEIVNGRGLKDTEKLGLLLHLVKVYGYNGYIERCLIKQLNNMIKNCPEKIDYKLLVSDDVKISEDRSAEFGLCKLRLAMRSGNAKEINNIINDFDYKDLGYILHSGYSQAEIFGKKPTDILGKDLGMLVECYPKIAGIVCDNYSDLVNDILDMKNISEEDKRKIIINIAEHLQGTDYYLVANDMLDHISDEKKLRIDGKRLLTAPKQKTSYDNSVKYSEEDFEGDINIDLKQQASNCWLVAGILSLAEKTKGQDKLKSLYTVDKEKRKITVKLDASSKAYIYRFYEVTQRNGVLSGDFKAKAVAMAVDDFLRDSAYISEEKTLQYDSEGNTGSKFFEIAFGSKTYTVPTFTLNKEELNREDRCYTLGYINNDFTAHAIAITHADDKFVYYNDPNGRKGKMSWNEFKTKAGTCSYIQL